MTQTLLVVVLFVGAMALLPWMVRRVQQRHSSGTLTTAGASRVVSVVAIGPQQRVVTVEVGPENSRTWLVLGVTAQQVSCLHVLPLAAGDVAAGALSQGAAASPSFAHELLSAVDEPGKRSHA